MLTNAPRTRSRTRVCKNQKFPCIVFASPPPTPPPRSGRMNGKEIFGFASPFQSPKRASLFYHLLFALFSALTATEAPCYPGLVVTLISANHAQPPSHSPLAFARAGCFGVACVRSLTSREFVMVLKTFEYIQPLRS